MDAQQIGVRPAQSGDREAIAKLAYRLVEGVAPWRDPKAVEGAAQQWLADSLTAALAGNGCVFVAVDDSGRVLGVVSVNAPTHFTGVTDAYVGELVVAEQAARSGVGRTLMAEAESWARSQGFRHLTLQTGAANGMARRFYKGLGYVEEEVRLTKPLQ